MSSKIADIRQSYVDGRFVSGDGEPLAVENPYTEEVIAQVETLSLAQMEDAVLAARARSTGTWSGLRREERIDAVRFSASTSPAAEALGATLTAEAGSTTSMLGAGRDAVGTCVPRDLPHDARRRAHARLVF
jgi:acyl-CoA reductase-like NAD-dependent aldehyde dehydrogenase